MTNDRLADMRKELEAELAAAERVLTEARAERATVTHKVKQAVAERDELKSALARLTPRAPRTKKPTASQPVTTEADGGAS